MSRIRVPLAALLALTLLAAACGGDDDGGTATDDSSPAGGGATGESADSGEATEASPADEVQIFGAEGNNLWAYADAGTDELGQQEVAVSAATDPDEGVDLNGQVCFFPDDPSRFVMGEDTNQPDPPAGWGVFDLSGGAVGDLSIEQVGKLTPSYQAAESDPENYGCGFLSDGRMLTTDVGNQAGGDGTGQLIVWFPPFDTGLPGSDTEVPYCKIDTGLFTPGGIAVDGDDVYVASARGQTIGVQRYSGDWPTGPDAAGGCGRTDATGAPLMDDDAVERDLFIAVGDNGLATPNAIVASPDGGWYVSSVITGVINEYDAEGAYVRTVLAPPTGEAIGAEPISTGTPFGLAVGPDGTVYYADIGIVSTPGEIGPGEATGSVRAIRFVDGEPQPPITVNDGLAFPDGITVRPAG